VGNASCYSYRFTVLLLLITSLAGFTQQSTIHRLQASSLEGQKQWQRAITEFQLAGEGAPTSVNIARTYVEWGEQLSSQQQYLDAGLKFDTVIQTYSSATAEVDRATSDKITDLLTWGKQAINQQNYSVATTILDGLLSLNYCFSVCQEQGGALDATAYYNLAKSELASQQYDNATRDFQTVLTRFNGSPEAHQLHPDLAQSILGQGQQQLASDCSSAIPTYQQLSTDFADTPAGQQAIKALHAPQPVTGHFITSIPNDPSLTPTAILAKNLYGGIPYDQEGQAINGAPTAKIESNGNFSFKSMQQGTYDLVWGSIRSDGAESFNFTSDSVTLAPTYVATVGPLCPFSFGDINESIPTP
jgi:tetratricopeptide (TPR) repeat protein